MIRKEIKLPNKKWGNPMETLRGAKFPDPKNQFIDEALGECARFYYFLEVIWERLANDYHIFNDQMILTQKRFDASQKGESIDSISVAEWQQEMKNRTYLRLDHYDFLIYSKILMDKFAYLAKLLLKEDISYRGFNKQKKFFLNQKNIPFKTDEEYAKYIREETEWFDRSLKLSRDELIVHSLPLMESIISSPKGTLTLLRTNWGGSLEKSWEIVKQLKTKYSDKYPELNNVHDNVFEILKFLIDNPEIKLDQEDKQKFLECFRNTGSKLPDINLLADKIIVFASFFGEHFRKRIDKD